MESVCRKRKRAGEVGHSHAQSNVVGGMQDVPLSGWIDLSSSRDSPLPPGWEQCLDLQSGKMYYVNTATQTRTLEDPRMLFKEQGTVGKGELLGLDLEMRLPSQATIVPSTLSKDIPNHCNGFQPSVNFGIAANPSLPIAPCSTNLSTATATNMMSNMAATVCMYCHTFVMVSRQAPHCPNCKNLCNMDLPITRTC